MAVTVTMPQLGETVTEGTILSWAKAVGDTIAEDEVLLEISTDKVDTEVPSPAAGVIQEILVAEGETVTVGTALAVIAGPDETSGPAAAPQAEPADAPAPPPAAAPSPQPGPVAAGAPAPPAPPVASFDAPRRGVLSPVVRRLAGQHGVDLGVVPGTGEGGRITRKDVLAYVEGGSAAPAAPAPATAEPAPAPPPAAAPSVPEPPPTPAPESAAPQPAPPPVAPSPAPAPAATAPAPPPVSAPAAAPEPTPAPPTKVTFEPAASSGTDQVVELSRLRRRIAENMVHSKRTAAHVWASVEVDYEVVERVRQKHKDAFKEREGFSLTYLPFISRATMDALAAYPVVNSAFDLENGTQTFHSRVDLGIAVDMNQGGLVVVTVRGADGLRLRGLARDVRERALRARDGKLEPDDIAGSTFTITNPGPYGSFMTAPIINVPNVAILSTDTVTKRATVVTLPDGSDTIAIHHIGYLGLTWDHRAFDGSTAVLFLNRIRENLENWDWEQELL